MIGKRFIVFDDGLSKHIEDTNYTEDKHEHNIYDCYEMCSKLNQQYNKIIKLEEENDKLTNHVKSIIDLLDGIIQANNYELEWGENNGVDCGCIRYVNEELEKIKKKN